MTEFVWLVWWLFAHSVASMLLRNAWKCTSPPPKSDNSCFGALFPLMTLRNAFERASKNHASSKNHAFGALAIIMLGTQSFVVESFGLFWIAFGGCCLA